MKKIILALIAFVSVPSMAAYTGNYSSKVSWIKTYNSDKIYFKLESMLPDHQCSADSFILSPTLTKKQKGRYFSTLSVARSSGSTISVGYDKSNPDCVSNRPVVHAISY